jgi:AAA15 family ATPase/GTPase
MLIRFFVENFLSFNQEVEFSMVAGKTEVLPHHVIKGEGRNDVNVLKTGVIYGANASGKSNLIKAMNFAKKFITETSRAGTPISRNYFKLNPANEEKPSKFQFDFKIKDKIYTYGFEIDNQWVKEEWLYEIGKTKDKPIFNRQTNTETEINVTFGQVKFKNKEEELFAHFTGRGTPANRLFLTEIKERNLSSIKVLNEVFEWFDDNLIILPPTFRYESIALNIIDNPHFNEFFLNILTLMNTGIDGLFLQQIDFEKDIVDIPKHTKEEFLQNLPNHYKGYLNVGYPHQSRYIVTKVNNEIFTHQLMTKHKVRNSVDNILFKTEDESDGTQRLFDIIPLLIDIVNEKKTYIIDELDRSLHPNLTRSILELFLESSKGVHSQLIVTTHEASLLDLKLLRKDEIWFTEKNEDGESKVYSLEEFHPRYDKEIRKGYLQGRFGAIPFIGNVKDLGWLKT